MKQTQIGFDIGNLRFQFIKLDSLWEINKVFVSVISERKKFSALSPDELDRGVDAIEYKHLLFPKSFSVI